MKSRSSSKAKGFLSKEEREAIVAALPLYRPSVVIDLSNYVDGRGERLNTKDKAEIETIIRIRVSALSQEFDQLSKDLTFVTRLVVGFTLFNVVGWCVIVRLFYF